MSFFSYQVVKSLTSAGYHGIILFQHMFSFWYTGAQMVHTHRCLVGVIWCWSARSFTALCANIALEVLLQEGLNFLVLLLCEVIPAGV